MTTVAEQKLNDVDLEAVGALVAAVKEDPEQGQTEWQATVTWKGAFRSEVSIRDFDPIPSDEPPGLGGTDTAPNPAEQVLGALGNCLAVGYAANASAQGVEINDLRIELSGDLDIQTFLGLKPGHAGYGGLSVKVHLDSTPPRSNCRPSTRRSSTARRSVTRSATRCPSASNWPDRRIRSPRTCPGLPGTRQHGTACLAGAVRRNQVVPCGVSKGASGWSTTR